MIYSLRIFLSVLLFLSIGFSLISCDHGDSNYCQAEYPTVGRYSMPTIADGKLKRIVLAHRHGARTPYSLLPYYKHPNSDATFNLCSMPATQSFEAFPTVGPNHLDRVVAKHPTIDSKISPFAKRMYQGNCMTGQLTDKGIQQLYRLGVELRTLYVNKLQFLPSSIDANTTEQSLYVRSTDVWRTLQSVQSLLSGLYPPQYGDQGDHEIPIVVLPAEIETLYWNSGACPAIGALDSKIASSDVWKKHLSDNNDLLKRLNAACSTTTVSDYSAAFSPVHDQIFTRYCHGVPLPCSDDKSQCISDNDREKLAVMGDIEYQLQYTFDEPTRVTSARLGISQFFTQLIDKFSSNDSALFNIFSAHDTSIYPIIAALNFTDARNPPYASNVVFELWSSESKGDFVRLLHNGQLQVFPFCGTTECPVNSFYDYLKTIIPNDLLGECQTTLLDEKPEVHAYGFRPRQANIPSYQF